MFKLNRRVLSIIGFTLALSMTGAPALFAGQVVRSKGNGAYVEAWGTDTTGCVWTYVNVSKGGTKAAPQTWMYYDVYDYCSGQWIAYGGGSISNTSLKVTGTTAKVTMTTSANASFYTEGLTGSVQLTFTADGFESSTYSGHYRSEYAGHKYQSHGTWTRQSATVSGSLLGYTIANMNGYFGEGRDKYMEIER
jgi:hypothetical protein